MDISYLIQSSYNYGLTHILPTIRHKSMHSKLSSPGKPAERKKHRTLKLSPIKLASSKIEHSKKHDSPFNIDVDSKELGEFFKRNQNRQQEITRHQLAQRLSFSQPMSFVNKMLQQLGVPTAMTQQQFRQILIQINSLSFDDAIKICFCAMDSQNKGFLSSKEVFELLRFSPEDCNYIFKHHHDYFVQETQREPSKRRTLITLLNEHDETPKRNILLGDNEHVHINLQSFRLLFAHRLPRAISQFIQALSLS